MSALLVLVVGPEGWAEPLWVERGEFLPECQALVGGLVDVVPVASSVDAWVNDEGLFVCEPNPVATMLVWSIRGFASPESMGPALFGRVVFTGGADGEGDTQGSRRARRRRCRRRPPVWPLTPAWPRCP